MLNLLSFAGFEWNVYIVVVSTVLLAMDGIQLWL